MFNETQFNPLHFVTETAKYLMSITPRLNIVTITPTLYSLILEPLDNEIIIEEIEGT